MKPDSPGRLKSFFRSKVGRIAFILIGIGAVFGTFAYVSTVYAIPVFLLVSLALPIYLGLKRPRFIAAAALIVILVVAPLATIVFSQEVLLPPAAASSAGTGPYEDGGAVLQNATISPFVGTTSTAYGWNVTLYPEFLNGSLTTTNWSEALLQLFISTCPGATTPNSSYCSSGYTLTILNRTFSNATPPTNGEVVSFSARIASNGIWSWQMELELQNKANASDPFRIELVGDPTYNAIEGPIIGGFLTAYGALIGTVYEIELIYLAIPYYALLLLYVWYKSRENRRKAAMRRAAQALSASTAAAGTAGATTGPSTPATGGAAGASPEAACPNCGAVVYPAEAKCWKCGSALPEAPSAPLPTKP